MRIIYEKTKGQVPMGPLLGKQKAAKHTSKEVYLKHLFLANSRDPRHVFRVPHVTEYIASRSTNQLLLCERYGRYLEEREK